MIRRGVIRADVLDTPRGTDWRERRACRDVDPELFHPAGNDDQGADKRGQIAEAKAVCEPCPVKAECLAFALETGASGVWGGTSWTQRRKMRPKKVAQCGTRAGLMAHRNRGEDACAPCKAAHAEYTRKRYRDADKRRAG